MDNEGEDTYAMTAEEDWGDCWCSGQSAQCTNVPLGQKTNEEKRRELDALRLMYEMQGVPFVGDDNEIWEG